MDNIWRNIVLDIKKKFDCVVAIGNASRKRDDVYTRTIKFLTGCNILTYHQFGFRQKHSTIQAILLLIDKVFFFSQVALAALLWPSQVYAILLCQLLLSLPLTAFFLSICGYLWTRKIAGLPLLRLASTVPVIRDFSRPSLLATWPKNCSFFWQYSFWATYILSNWTVSFSLSHNKKLCVAPSAT